MSQELGWYILFLAWAYRYATSPEPTIRLVPAPCSAFEMEIHAAIEKVRLHKKLGGGGVTVRGSYTITAPGFEDLYLEISTCRRQRAERVQ